MPAPRKYDQETRDRAVRMFLERRQEILKTVSAFFAAAELDRRLK